MPDQEETISGLDAIRAAAGREPAQHLGLLIAWSNAEPDRIGEVALLPEGTVVTLGRGEGSGEPRARLVRQRPGVNEPGGPLGGLGLSRDQLRIEARGDALDVTLTGKPPLELRGAEVERCTLRVGDAVIVRGQLLLLCVKRPEQLPPSRGFPADALAPFGQPDALGILGEAPATWRLREQVAFAAQAAGHVLILGESGAGKELSARAVHRLSARRDRALVARNAATLPPGLIDAELFGHVRNYPNVGMPERAGLVGEAHGGILFLDEIAQLPAELQAHLLRVLDAGGEYQRLGDAAARRSDFLLVAATNRDPSGLAHDFGARFPLRIEVPSLRERTCDVPLLVRHLLLRACERSPALLERFVAPVGGAPHPRVDPALVLDLLTRSLPGNVRELDALLWRALSESDGDAVLALRERVEPTVRAPEEPSAQRIRDALRDQAGSVTRAAAALGLPSRFALYRLMKRLGLSSPEE
jgi:transcriptional regulator with AAA-type ATPase domain